MGKSLSLSSLAKEFLAIFILTVIYGFFLWGGYWGLGFTILNTVFLFTIVLIKPALLKNKEVLFYIFSSLILSLFIIFRTYWLGRDLTFLLVFILNCLILIRASSPEFQLKIKDVILGPLGTLFNGFGQIPFWITTLNNTVKSPTGSVNSSSLKTIVYGTIIAVPLLLIFGVLFSMADPLFAKYLNNLLPKWSFTLDLETLVRYSELIIAASLISALIRVSPKQYEDLNMFSIRDKDQSAIAIATVLVSILVGFFLIVQAQYLFAGDSLLKQLNIYHSEYTRKGFAELLIVASISLVMIFILAREKDHSRQNLIRGISLMFIFETILVLLSALWRDYMYQDIFGFTQARLLGFVFSLWLIGTILIVAFLILKSFNPQRLISLVFLNTIFAVLILNLINVDYLAGAVKKPNLGWGIDYAYVSRLSSDAWPGWKDTIDYLENTQDCRAYELNSTSNLQIKLKDLESQSKDNWHRGGAFTYPDAAAYSYILKEKDHLLKLKDRFANCYRPEIRIEP